MSDEIIADDELIEKIKSKIALIESKTDACFADDFKEAATMLQTLEQRYSPLPLKNGGSPAEVLQWKNIALKYKESEEKLRMVVRNADALIFIIDNNGIITLSEGKALNLFKFLPNQIAGISIFDIYYDKPIVQDEIRKALSGKTTSSRLEIQDYVFESVFSPYRDAKGNINGVVAVAIDVTERVKMIKEREELIENLQLSSKKIFQDAGRLMHLNDKLIDSEEKLRRMNDEKDKFISIISHDLRSPFSGILGMTDGLVTHFDAYSREELRTSLEMLSKTGRQIYDLLENLLLWAKVNRGKMVVSKEKLPLYAIAKANIELVINNAISKNITIKNEVGRKIFVFADENMLSTVIRNLLSNAIKFTGSGGEIKVSTNKTLYEDIIEIKVCDNGVGMPPEAVEKIFSLRKKQTTLGTNNEKGSGLGLFICKEMIEQNEGKIRVESSLGKGTCFIIELKSVEEEDYIPEEEETIERTFEDKSTAVEDSILSDFKNLSTENQKNLLREIQERYLPQCREVSETQILSSIKAFAVNLKKTSDEYGSKALSSYASSLLEKVKMMDLSGINKLLDVFPSFEKKLQEF